MGLLASLRALVSGSKPLQQVRAPQTQREKVDLQPGRPVVIGRSEVNGRAIRINMGDKESTVVLLSHPVTKILNLLDRNDSRAVGRGGIPLEENRYVLAGDVVGLYTNGQRHGEGQIYLYEVVDMRTRDGFSAQLGRGENMFARLPDGLLYEVGRDSESGALYYRNFSPEPCQEGAQNSDLQGACIQMAPNGTVKINSVQLSRPVYEPTISITMLDPLDDATLVSGPPAGMEETEIEAPTMFFRRQESESTLVMGSGHLRPR